MKLDDLALLQREFAAALGAGAPAPEKLGACFANEAGAGAQRFARYRSALLQHQALSLSRTYPVLQALVGEVFFRGLAHAYGNAHGSGSPDLSRFGAHLPAFLGSFEAVAAYPYFVDVARLEWSMQCASSAADDAPVDARTVARCSAAQIDALALRLHPACALHASAWASAGLWFAHQVPPTRALPANVADRTRALVYRTHWRVHLRELELPEWTALEVFQRGSTLGEALLAAQAQYAGEPAGFDPGALFTRWLADGILTPAPALQARAAASAAPSGKL